MSTYEPLEEEFPNEIFHQHNIAIALAYFSVGAVNSLITTPLNIYMVEVLNAEPAMQNTISILQTLPWSLKLIFGFMSDALPINGMHRKPYLTIGAIVYSASLVLYAISGHDNVVFLAICIFFGTLGLIQMDVMADTMCVERSKFEEESKKGQMQATCYSIRFAGSLFGALLGAAVCNQKSWGWGLTFPQVAFLNGMVPIVLVTPFLSSLRERYHKIKARKPVDEEIECVSLPSSDNAQPAAPDYQATETTPMTQVHPLKKYKSFWSIQEEVVDSTVNVRVQMQEIWETVQLQAVWRPMAFVYIYNLFQVPNVAWQSFLQLSLGFPTWVLGLSVILGSFMTLAGILAYKHYFFKTSWRYIYISTTALIAFFSMLQLVLIFQLNIKYLGLSNYFFSLGDDVISAYINGIQFLPVCIMYMRLCPDGAEGASYSMLTTFGNVALVCASNIGNYLTTFWDVSNDSMRSHDISGLWKLAAFTSAISMLPLAFLSLLPASPKEQDELAKSSSRSKVGGFIFLLVLFVSLGWTTTSALLELRAQ